MYSVSVFSLTRKPVTLHFIPLAFIRLAVERDVEKGGALGVCNILYDESGYFLLYATMLGVKIVNLYNSRLVRTIGKPENLRLLNLALFQVCSE